MNASFLIYCALFTCLNALRDDLLPLFGDKKCIEASLSLLSITDAEFTNTVVENGNPLKIPLKTTLALKSSENERIKIDSKGKNVKAKLNELAQYNEISYEYELISEEGLSHERVFKITLKLGNEIYHGAGSSLKAAQNSAALVALENTLYKHPPLVLKDEEATLTPTVVLNNVATKLGVSVSYELLTDRVTPDVTTSSKSKKSYYQKLNESVYHPTKDFLHVPTETAQLSGPFSVNVKVGGNVYNGFGHSIQMARHDAATKALKGMEKEILLEDQLCFGDDSSDECKLKRESLKSAITRVYEAGQKHNLVVDFQVVGETGKSHKKTFVIRCQLGEFWSEGEGASKKEAKRIAAEKMLGNLGKLPEVIDGKNIIKSVEGKKKKKKKKKIIKSSDKEKLANIIDFFWGENNVEGTKIDSNKKQQPKVSPKGKLLEVGNLLNLEVQFTDLSQQKGDFYALLSMGLKPHILCLGKAALSDDAHDEAALHGLKFLHKSGLLDSLDFYENKQNGFSIDGFVVEDELNYEPLYEEIES